MGCWNPFCFFQSIETSREWSQYDVPGRLLLQSNCRGTSATFWAVVLFLANSWGVIWCSIFSFLNSTERAKNLGKVAFLCWSYFFVINNLIEIISLDACFQNNFGQWRTELVCSLWKMSHRVLSFATGLICWQVCASSHLSKCVQVSDLISIVANEQHKTCLRVPRSVQMAQRLLLRYEHSKSTDNFTKRHPWRLVLMKIHTSSDV